MPSTKFTKRNLNRFRKVYPYLRREPRYELVSTKEALIEIAEVPFNETSTSIYVFSESFPGPPIVTATSVDSELTSTADVNVFITELNSTQVKLETSGIFTGVVHIHAIYIGV